MKFLQINCVEFCDGKNEKMHVLVEKGDKCVSTVVHTFNPPFWRQRQGPL